MALIAYVSSEFGDYNQSENLPGYLSDYSFIPNQPQDFEKEIAKLHQQHIGLSPAEAEFNYLNTARTLELYGVEFHYARDQSNNEIMIGVMSGGILIYKNRMRMNTFPCGRTEVQSVQYGKEKANKDRVFARSPSKPLARKLMDWEVVSRNSLSDDRLETQSLPSRSPPGTPNQSQETPEDGQPPALPPKQSKKNSWNQIHFSHSQQDLLNHTNETFDVPCSPEKSTPNGGIPHDNLVLIKMKPDENGRFGFNVKGGFDQKMPVIVSRVAPGTPADLCVPRLNEGDQVVLINGRDIAEHTHDQVVLFIKASCERHSGELVLLVRPNAVYDVVEEKLESEPDFQYIPEKAPLDSVHQDDHSLRESMIQLAEGLITGTVLAQFDKNESRQLTQIQYTAWPDHGVPDDSSDFLDFVCHVRNKRAGKEEPIVVHCSAGIGRTGVLITMETAMCLIECNQPIYPLDIVRTMRDQRAMMIQTPGRARLSSWSRSLHGLHPLGKVSVAPGVQFDPLTERSLGRPGYAARLPERRRGLGGEWRRRRPMGLGAEFRAIPSGGGRGPGA
ncbi:Tyrosine-protein phosphatase non-receptor type 4 [Microtus ochrogaster]|uniref:protein-tyrosine-phosphatase n=1 Tax=Microtus ochrogaster TaxID=79684 RepID=A0A8J6FXI9_MICOH|nr:Tyrosine-protein phosphatase non-receptor type 4 [Microtus ochrogaster]